MNTVTWHGLPHLDPACPAVRIRVRITAETQSKLLVKHLRNPEESWSLLLPWAELQELRRSTSANDALNSAAWQRLNESMCHQTREALQRPLGIMFRCRWSENVDAYHVPRWSVLLSSGAEIGLEKQREQNEYRLLTCFFRRTVHRRGGTESERLGRCVEFYVRRYGRRLDEDRVSRRDSDETVTIRDEDYVPTEYHRRFNYFVPQTWGWQHIGREWIWSRAAFDSKQVPPVEGAFPLRPPRPSSDRDNDSPRRETP